MMPAHGVDALLAHEVSVHLLTHFNGAAQGLTVFRTGLAHYEGVQEGLGVFAEWAVGGLSRTRLRLLAGRVVAVDAMLDGAEFVEVYRGLRRRPWLPRNAAFDIATRVFRSGGFAKDVIYLQGLQDVIGLVAAGASLDPFWIGKIAARPCRRDRRADPARAGPAAAVQTRVSCTSRTRKAGSPGFAASHRSTDPRCRSD